MPDTTCEVTFFGLVFGNTWNNVIHVVSTLDPIATADVLDTVWVDRFKAWQHSSCSWLGIKVRPIGGLAPFTKALNKVGTAASAGNVDQVLLAMCVQLQTASAGRAGKGRVFIAGTKTDSSNLGIVTPATFTAFNPTLANIMADIGPSGTQGVELGVASRADPVGTFKSVTGMTLRANLATCRRRQYGQGS